MRQKSMRDLEVGEENSSGAQEPIFPLQSRLPNPEAATPVRGGLFYLLGNESMVHTSHTTHTHTHSSTVTQANIQSVAFGFSLCALRWTVSCVPGSIGLYIKLLTRVSLAYCLEKWRPFLCNRTTESWHLTGSVDLNQYACTEASHVSLLITTQKNSAQQAGIRAKYRRALERAGSTAHIVLNDCCSYAVCLFVCLFVSLSICLFSSIMATFLQYCFSLLKNIWSGIIKRANRSWGTYYMKITWLWVLCKHN